MASLKERWAGERSKRGPLPTRMEMLRSSDGRSCELVTWNLQTDIGMTCGGEVKFFFELYLCNDWKISLFGAGHIAQALVPILLQMNCRVTWLDQRQDWLSRLPEHPKLTKVCSQNLKDEVKRLDPRSFFVLMTQGHATDLPVLAEVLRTIEPPYVGVLGSLQKAKVLRRDLKRDGNFRRKDRIVLLPDGSADRKQHAAGDRDQCAVAADPRT